MAKTLTNFVDGKVAALDGRELELVDPLTGEVFVSPRCGARGHRPCVSGRADRLRVVA